MEKICAYNMKLVSNILPLHVAEHFLKTRDNKSDVSGPVVILVIVEVDVVIIIIIIINLYFLIHS